jgi:fumarate hydratase subunit alpha
MKKITEKMIMDAVSLVCIKANTHLRKDIAQAFERALTRETQAQPKKILNQLIENARVAKAENIALCQDTGLPVVFVDVGKDVDIAGVDMDRAVNKGVAAGYRRGFLRNSIVRDPLTRSGGYHFTPCIIHYHFGKHQGLKLTVAPKGFGCENKTKLAMFDPTVSQEEIKDFIVSVVKDAGPDACPPYVVGIGIGGSADYACQLSKEVLLRPIDKRNKLSHVAQLEKELMSVLNKTDIGPMGLGGKTTVLGVNIATYPTHMAGLPVCVNISCHVLRSASVTIH